MRRVKRDTESVQRARVLVDKWMPRFGFDASWRVEVYRLQDQYKGNVWAHGFWNIEEEHVIFEFVPDGAIPSSVLEMLVIHEVAHGLFQLASASDHGEEVACNRIAKLLKPAGRHPNEWFKRHEPFYASKEAQARTATSTDYLSYLVDAGLSEKQRFVIQALFWERLGLDAIAAELGISKNAVVCRRDRALRKLRNYIERIEGSK